MHCRLPIFDCRLECQLSDSPNRQLAIGNSEGWLRGRDLNPRPLGYEPNELPDCSTPRQSQLELPRPKRAPEIRQPDEIFQIKNRKSQVGNALVGLGRVELPTSRLSGVRSNQLSYRPLGSLPRQMPDKLVCRKPRPVKACRNMHPLNAKKSHTSLLRSVCY